MQENSSHYGELVEINFSLGDYMATLRDDILREIAGCCISDESASWAADKVAKLVEETFTSTNSAITPPEERDCDTCSNDGMCYVTMLHCKGYVRAAQ